MPSQSRQDSFPNGYGLNETLTTSSKTLYDQFNFEPIVKKILPVVFALSMISTPVLAWGWGGNGDCPYSKGNANQEKTEQVEESRK